MKKFTFLTLLFVCSVVFGQTKGLESAVPQSKQSMTTVVQDAPQKAQKPNPVTNLKVERAAVTALGIRDNNALYTERQSTAVVPTVITATGIRDNNTLYTKGQTKAEIISALGVDYLNQDRAVVSTVQNRMGGGSDDCATAVAVVCGGTYVGDTITATDTGGNPAPDVWYAYTGTSPGTVTLSLCDGGTDYDSYLRVFDACGGTEIAANDDACGLQSELSFTSDGASTYFIMVEGFGSNSGNYSMVVSCALESGADDCASAGPISCGDTFVGDTSTATDTGGNPAPDVWYTFTGGGFPETVTLSLCDGGTGYDSLLRVFDACGGTEIATNDDSCGLQSELSFDSDGTSTYNIMVEGFGSGSGAFSLAVSCVTIGGGCGEANLGDPFENGWFSGGPNFPLQVIATDVTVAADKTLI